VAQKPKLSDFIPRMVNEIAHVLEIEGGRVNVKATTSEGLGFTGRGEGSRPTPSRWLKRTNWESRNTVSPGGSETVS